LAYPGGIGKRGGSLDSFMPLDYSRLAAGQFRQDTPQMREYAANVPLDVLRGRFAGMLGFPSDVLNMVRTPSPMEMFGQTDYEQPTQVPYGTEQLLKTLPLAPAADNPLGQAANRVGSFVPITPMEALQAARVARQAAMATGRFVAPKAGQLAEGYMQRMGMMPSIVPVEGASVASVNQLPQALIRPKAEVSPLGFYSAVEQQALNLPRKSGTGASFINDLMKGQDVKKYEIEAMGLDEFLKDKPNVTRQEVQDFIAGNRVNVQEKQLGGALSPEMQTTRDELNNKYKGLVDNIADAKSQFEEGKISYAQLRNTVSNNQIQIQALDTQINEINKTITPTKYDRYQLPGGDNYREILLTTPVKGKAELDAAQIAAGDLRRQTADLMEQWKSASELNPGDPSVVALYQRVADSRRLRDQAETKAQELKNQIGSQTYQSSHFNEPNVLAHMRVNDRIDADGKKMLLIEEVQSDWHQAGREKGYGPKYEESFMAYYETKDGQKIPLGYGNTKKEAEASIDVGWKNQVDIKYETHKRTISEGVPDAPFKDTWHQLALKRAIKEAVDKGYDRIGLTTGAQQAERYDLSKQISKVYYSPPDSKQANKFGTVFKAFDSRGHEIINKSVTPEELPGIVGKEVAQKLLNAESNSMGVKALEGIDLSVGGEGMKKYYDEIYPAFLAKQGKKYGAKVGETRIKTGRGVPGGEAVRYLDITPEMRKAVKEGQPLASMQNELANQMA
jgi:hypothetical protein